MTPNHSDAIRFRPRDLKMPKLRTVELRSLIHRRNTDVIHLGIRRRDNQICWHFQLDSFAASIVDTQEDHALIQRARLRDGRVFGCFQSKLISKPLRATGQQNAASQHDRRVIHDAYGSNVFMAVNMAREGGIHEAYG
jgi:hypothetical protein